MKIIIYDEYKELEDLHYEKLLVCLAQTSIIVKELENKNIAIPYTLKENLEELEIEVNRRTRTEKQKRLQELKVRKEALLPRETKLKNIEEEIKGLEQSL